MAIQVKKSAAAAGQGPKTAARVGLVYIYKRYCSLFIRLKRHMGISARWKQGFPVERHGKRQPQLPLVKMRSVAF